MRIGSACAYAPSSIDPKPASPCPSGVFESNSAVWPLMRGFSATMRSLSGPAAAGCRPAGRAPAAAGPCGDAGYEGPGCNIDINECARQTAGCDPNAACTNQAGGFACHCFDGYTGDGASCQPAAALADVQTQYVSDGAARLACSEGRDVVYPEGAPGFQYDVTGALDRVKGGGQKVGSGGSGPCWHLRRQASMLRVLTNVAAAPVQDGYGSRSAVEPISCMLACNAAPGCDSFSYNAAQKRCFLKSGASRQTCGSAPTVCVSARGKTYSCGVWMTYFKRQATGGSTAVTQAPSKASSAAANDTPASSSTASKQLAAAFSRP